MTKITYPYKTMNIVHFTGTYEKGKDGVTHVLHNMEEYNNRYGIDSIVVTPVPDPRKNIYQYVTPSLKIPAYDGYRIAFPNARIIERQLRLFQPDIIHFHSPCLLAFVAQKIARKLHIPCVATYHTHFPTYFKYHNNVVASTAEQWFRRYNLQVYKNCDSIFIPSRSLLTELAGDGLMNGEFLPHGVNPDIFSPTHRSQQWREQISGSEKSEAIILYVGRLVWEKNLRRMIEVYNHLSSTNHACKWVIVGTGPAQEQLQSSMPNATFLGYQSGNDLSRAYASSDIFFFPSDTETFGLVTLEAMASGLTCCVASSGGSQDLIQNRITGFTYCYDSTHEMYTALSELISNRTLRSDLAARSYAHSKLYSWKSIFDQLIQRYSNLCIQKSVVKSTSLRPWAVVTSA